MTELNLALQSIRTSQNKVNTIVAPCFYRLYNKEDKEAFLALLLLPGIIVSDYILDQLKELIKHETPNRKFTNEELETNAHKHLGDVNMDEYGVWVHYPWSNRLVHILDEKEFIDLRTSRNQHKITTAERDLLAKKKIGVIGLSVGQSVSVTLAMERICGELRLADFDILELTNLNRIRSGIYNLGIKKVVTVAREIAEIDPFLKVICFGDGLTEENMDAFFLEGGKLDVLIDECDGLDIKILCRYKAKSLKIPVVMDASDRGTLDVERFDLEPDRSILHGLIDHLDHTKLKHLETNEEKIPYILPMLGTETISNRMKASMVEIEQTITTWPQLASAVVLGGALAADVCRRIILDQYHESGRYFVDLEQLVGDKKSKVVQDSLSYDFYNVPSISFESMNHIVSKLKLSDIEAQVIPDKASIEVLIKAATFAPSTSNCQPWKWLFEKGILYLFHDKSHSVSFGDFEEKASMVSFGAAIENLAIKTHSFNLELIPTLFPLSNEKLLISAFRFSNKSKNTSTIQIPTADNLVEIIELRLTNRNNGERVKINNSTYEDLQSIVNTVPGAKLWIAKDDTALEELASIIGAADRLRFLHPFGHYDFFSKEIRWNKEEVESTNDGLDVATFDLTPSELTGLNIAKDPNVIKYLNEWKGGKAFEKMSRKAIASASAIGFITMPEYNNTNYINGGRAMQKAWLLANKNNVSMHPMLAPIFLFTRLNHGNGIGMSEEMCAELQQLRNRFLKIFPINENQGEIFLFRLSVAKQPSVRSLRRPIKEVLSFGRE